MARRYWSCRRCGHRNERTASRTCDGCGYKTKPATRRPAHMKALDLSYEQYGEINELLHGVDAETCAICGEPGKSDVRLQRDHSHYGGYPRGLTHAACNGRLGQIEGGRWARGEDFDLSGWLRKAADYIDRSRNHHASKEEAA